jgi:hypothetical protein
MVDVPFIRQNGPTNCGAAALQMVYYAYGIDRRQDDIFHDVSERPENPDPANIPNIMLSGSKLYRLVDDAIAHGLYGMVFQARNIPKVLDACHRYGVPAIAQQATRVTEQSSEWHFRVFNAVYADAFKRELYYCFRDPAHYQPDMLMTPDEAAACSHGFQRAGGSSDLIAPIGNAELRREKCKTCETKFPKGIACRCDHVIDLTMGRILGCMNAHCQKRRWKSIGCTKCGAYLSF